MGSAGRTESGRPACKPRPVRGLAPGPAAAVLNFSAGLSCLAARQGSGPAAPPCLSLPQLHGLLCARASPTSAAPYSTAPNPIIHPRAAARRRTGRQLHLPARPRTHREERNNCRHAALRAVTLTAKVHSFTPESARPRTHQKEETPKTFKHQKEQTPDTPPLRTVTLTARVRGFILQVSETKNPPIPDTVSPHTLPPSPKDAHEIWCCDSDRGTSLGRSIPCPPALCSMKKIHLRSSDPPAQGTSHQF
ncbi:uncharacterized protein [Symphalangus syndactylus]|uniref:uncharacterized protein n=1 Tax=Symphalangus syndactylus TaxID=9590 RepID=UPI003007429A